MVPCSPRCFVACRFCRHRPVYWRNPALRPFEEDSTLQDSFNVDNETPRAVVLQISNHLVLFENRTSQNLMVYQCLSWFINVYHGLSESVHFQAAI